MDGEALSQEDFWQMSEEFFPYKGLPVLFRDILYNLLGYFYAVSDNPEETISFYSRLIKDNQQYIKRKEDMQYYLELGCNPESVHLAEILYGQRD